MRIIILPSCNELQLNLKVIFNSFHFFHFSRFEGPSVFMVITPATSNIDDNKIKTRNAKNQEIKKEETEEEHHLCLMSITSGKKSRIGKVPHTAFLGCWLMAN